MAFGAELVVMVIMASFLKKRKYAQQTKSRKYWKCSFFEEEIKPGEIYEHSRWEDNEGEYRLCLKCVERLKEKEDQ